jgi:hypothetical protein
MAKVNLEDNYIWGTSGTGVPGGVISSGSYTMHVDYSSFPSTGSWSSSGFGKPTPAKEKIYTVTGRLKKIKCTQN